MLLLFVIGGIGMIVGAELLVRGATRLASAVGVSSLVIGLTVVSLGTSAPEIAISIDASLSGHGDMSIGNVVGSNIFNVLVVLGVAALIGPLLVARRLLWWDIPLMIGFAVLMWLLSLNGTIGRLEGLLFCLCLAGYIWWTVRISRREHMEIQDGAAEAEDAEQERTVCQIVTQLALFGAGLVMLVYSADWFIQGAATIARALGVSDLVISLTLVAVGTSLPEVVISALASYRGQRDIAVGNVIGSSIFNILAVLGIAALVVPGGITVPVDALRADIPIMLGTFVACLPIFTTGYVVSRWEGGLFLGYYAAYIVFLFLQATGHAALPVFTQFMLFVAIPLTAITLLFQVGRQWMTGRAQDQPEGGLAPGEATSPAPSANLYSSTQPPDHET